MRIFCAVRHSINPTYFYGGLWSRNFYPALRGLGHEIIESQIDLLTTSRFMHVPGDFTRQELAARADTTEHILNEVRQTHSEYPIDIFLSYFYNAHFDPAGFKELQRLGIPSVNFYCNSIYQFENVSKVAPAVDFSWYPEKDARASYLRVGANPIRVQMAADPLIYRPVPQIEKKPSACFVGQRYADRDRWMAVLIAAGVPVEIYGPGWGADEKMIDKRRAAFESRYLGRLRYEPGTSASYIDNTRRIIAAEGIRAGVARLARQILYRQRTRWLFPLFASHAKGPIEFERISEVFAGCEVCLNFSKVWADGHPGSELISHVRLRDFEAPMCRACYLTGHSDEIEEFYEIGKEIDTYRTPDELVDKTKFYLNNSSSAERLRAGGYERARNDHTWVKRFEELFRKIGINN